MPRSLLRILIVEPFKEQISYEELPLDIPCLSSRERAIYGRLIVSLSQRRFCSYIDT